MVNNGNCIHSPSLHSSMNFRECSKFDNLHYFREKKRLFLVFHLLALVSSFGDVRILNVKHITTVLASTVLNLQLPVTGLWLPLSLGFKILVKYIYFPLIFIQCNMQPDCLFICVHLNNWVKNLFTRLSDTVYRRQVHQFWFRVFL